MEKLQRDLVLVTLRFVMFQLSEQTRGRPEEKLEQVLYK